MDHSHAHLVKQASRGDGLAVDSLLARHMPALLAYVRLHAGERLLARESSMDLVQSACREVLQDLERMRYRDEANFKHWLFLAVERKLVDRARFHERDRRDARCEEALQPPLSSEESRCLRTAFVTLTTPSREAIAREELERAQRAFASLPGDYRDVILLSRIVGLPHAEIAQQMGRSETAVRMLLHRALARLAREMGPDAD